MEIETILQEHDSLIETMAGIALRRVRKPTIHTLEDLKQEGRARIIECVRRWWKPNTGASIKTFITKCLISKFSDIVHKSYHVLEEVPENQRLPQHAASAPDPLEISAFWEVIEEDFTPEEREYVSQFLASPMSNSMTRAAIRKAMCISWDEEMVIRKSIQGKLGGV